MINGVRTTFEFQDEMSAFYPEITGSDFHPIWVSKELKANDDILTLTNIKIIPLKVNEKKHTDIFCQVKLEIRNLKKN